MTIMVWCMMVGMYPANSMGREATIMEGAKRGWSEIALAQHSMPNMYAVSIRAGKSWDMRMMLWSTSSPVEAIMIDPMG